MHKMNDFCRDTKKNRQRAIIIVVVVGGRILLYTVRKHENVVDNTYDYFRCGVKIGSIT